MTDQVTMLPPTRVNTSQWYQVGQIARLSGQPRHHVIVMMIDLRAQNAWLDGWDAENRRMLNVSGVARCEAAREHAQRRRRKSR